MSRRRQLLLVAVMMMMMMTVRIVSVSAAAVSSDAPPLDRDPVTPQSHSSPASSPRHTLAAADGDDDGDGGDSSSSSSSFLESDSALAMSTRSRSHTPRRKHSNRPPNKNHRHVQSAVNKKANKKLSFVAMRRRRNRRNRAAAKRRAGKWSAHLGPTRADFGCGSKRHKCVCPMPLNAGFAALQVAAAQLMSEQRLQESSACYAQAMDMYLDRVGRYYVAGSNGDASSPSPSSSSSTPPSSSSSSTPLPPVDLSAAESANARSTAAAIVDRLNRGPEDGWSARKRTRSPEVNRLRHLADTVALPDDSLARLDSPQARAVAKRVAERAAAESAKSNARSASTKPHAHWQEEVARDPTHQRLVASIYDQQLRSQWKEWTAAEANKNHKPIKKRR